MREKAGSGCRAGEGAVRAREAPAGLSARGLGPAGCPRVPLQGPAHLVVPQAHVLRGLLHLLQDELLPPPLLQAPLGQQALVHLASPFALLLLGPHFFLALLGFALLLLGLRTKPRDLWGRGLHLRPLHGPHSHRRLTLDFFLASFALGAFASCFCLFLAWEGQDPAQGDGS